MSAALRRACSVFALVAGCWLLAVNPDGAAMRSSQAPGTWHTTGGTYVNPDGAAARSSQASFAQQAMTLDEYLLQVRAAQVAAQRGDRLELEQLAAGISGSRTVRLSNGEELAVDNRWLAEAVVAPNPDLAAIAARLAALLDVLALPPQTAPPDAQARLRAMLDAPPFSQPQDPSLAAQLMRWLWDMIGRLFRPLGHVGPGTAELFGWIIALAGFAVVLGLLFFWLRGLRRALVGEARVDDGGAVKLNANAALAEASQLARGGDYRSAVRYLYLAALFWLDERNLLRYDRALTNREYLERLVDSPALRARLTPIVETFDRVWYGHAAIGAEEFAAYQRLVEALREEPR